MQAMRSLALAAGLVAFAIGFSLDDLRVLRWPGYWFGLAGGVLCITAGPLWMGRRYARDHLDLEEKTFAARVARMRRIGALTLLATALLFVAWLSVFSAGVPPWAK